jgi:hypothetical protein
MDKSQKDTWKNEADQLKKDLNSRPKKVIRREVEVRFPGTAATSPKSQQKKPTNTKLASDFLRRQLGI